MAGEDPGVGVITLLLDVAQRAASAVIGFFKGVVNTLVDIAKMLVFMSWRRQAQQGQGSRLKHGKQSLKHLRRHEDRGAQLISAEIGDRAAMKALDKELKALELDYAITGNRSDGYVLHYKKINEHDVLFAQQHALEKLYGDPDQAQPEQETQNNSDNRDQQDRAQGERDRDGREERKQDNQHEERERNDEELEQQGNQTQDQSDQRYNRDQDVRDVQQRQDQQDREQRDSDQRREPAPTPTPAPIEAEESPAEGKASRGKHARQEAPAMTGEQPASPRTQHSTEAPSHAERMPAAPSHSQRTPQIQTQAKDAPQFEPLENIIAKARERAAAKNAGRSHAIDRTKDRIRAREVNFSH